MTHEFTYSNGFVQQKKLIRHCDYLRVRRLPEDEQEKALQPLTDGLEWFTDKSPYYEAIKTGVLNCNGSYICKVVDLKKEGAYLLQLIDCNCNDCWYLVRNLSRLPDKGKPSPINYGFCGKFKKDVSFIPAICQLETQNCFTHRKTHKQ